MAKKSSNRRNPSAGARSGASPKPQASTATLVRAGGAGASVTAPAASTPSTPKPATPAAASVVRDTPARSAAPSPKPSPKPASKPAPVVKAPAPATMPARTAAPARPAADAAGGKRQDTRVARARATQRARQAGLISAENYSYVLGDLKLVAALAIAAFAILIVLAFVLPH